MKRLRQQSLLAIALGLLWLPLNAAACATCFGKSDSPLAEGMNMGILTLLFIVGGVLMTLAGFFVFLMWRASAHAAASASAPTVAATDSQ